MKLTKVHRFSILQGEVVETKVYLSRNAEKNFKRLPKFIRQKFELWMELIESDGFHEMQKINSYRDHALKGNRLGQRSSSLTRSWRVIYVLDDSNKTLLVEVLEVNNHDY